jgi:hypothetical protein
MYKYGSPSTFCPRYESSFTSRPISLPIIEGFFQHRVGRAPGPDTLGYPNYDGSLTDLGFRIVRGN